jgi:hypothetical protein
VRCAKDRREQVCRGRACPPEPFPASSGSLAEFDTWTGDIRTISGAALDVHAPLPVGLCGVRAATNTLGGDYWLAPQQRRLIRIGDALFGDAFE